MKADWHSTTLKELCVVDWGNTNLTKGAYVDGGEFLAVSAAGCDGRINHKEHLRHTPVLSAIGAQCGRMFLPDEDFTAIKNTITLTPREGKSIGAFLYYLFTYIKLPQRGAGQPFISKGDIQSFNVTCPHIPEQQRIVGILDEAFEGIATAKANAEKNLQNARALFESHLHSIFIKRGPGWADRQLASLCHEITVGHVGPMKTEYKQGGVPFLRSQNIRPFAVSMDNAMFIDDAFHRALKKSQLRPGDLAIVRTGYPGTAAVIPPELPDSNCSDLVILRPTKEVNPHFLAAFFNSAFGKQIVLGKIVGAAQKHFNITAAKEVMLHLPPMAEQNTLVDAISTLREETLSLESIYQRKQAALESMKKSLLHQAFSGNL